MSYSKYEVVDYLIHSDTQYKLHLAQGLDNPGWAVGWTEPRGKILRTVFTSKSEKSSKEHFLKIYSRGPRELRDFQKQRVYNWENEVVLPNNTELTESKIKNLANRVHEYINQFYQRSKPELNLGYKRNFCYYDTKTHAIFLNKKGYNSLYVLHELAHAYNYYKYDGGHGASFVKIATMLYEEFMGIDHGELSNGIMDYKLVVAE
jgi:hypothetical protein